MKWLKTNFILFFLSISTFLYGQNASIRGVVFDEQTKLPMEFTSVALLKAVDSTIVSGVITQPNGSFEFNKLSAGTYLLRIVFVGYKTKITSPIDLIRNNKSDLGRILLSPSPGLLNQVTVVGTSAASVNRIDKQMYRADQFEAAKGGTAIEVLKNLPAVSVNGEGEISVRGSSGFLVLVNGKPVLTDAQTVLSQLPANVIANVELITSPSAKYDPDGRGGIINIVTKKGANDGFTLTANAQAGLPSTTDHNNVEKPKRFGGDLTLNFRKGKWDLSGGGNYLRADVAGYREGEVFTTNIPNNTISRFPSNGERSFDKYNYAGRFSAIYSASDKDVISFSFFSGKRYQDRLADILYNNTTSDLTTGAFIKGITYFNSNLQNKQGKFTLGNFDYTHTFANKSSLTTSFLYENANLYGNTRNINFTYPITGQEIQNVFNPYKNPINGYRFKLDHALPIGKGKLESGYQLRYDTQDGTFNYEVSPVTSQTDADRFRGTAAAKNLINSVFSQYSGKTKKLDYILGLRYEYAARTVNLSYDPNPHELNLSNLFPSVSFLYNSSDRTKFKAGYSKRIQRNNNFELNPIPEREHSETLEQGDPDLLPPFVDLAELGIVKSFDKGSFFSTVYYQRIKNPIQRVNSVYADTILNRVFTNADRARTFGMEIGTNLQPTKQLDVYLGANLYNYKINGDLNILGVKSVVDNADWVYSINGNANLKLGLTWSVQANINYLSERPTAQGRDSRFLVPNTSVKKTFANGRFNASLLWQNMDLGMNKSNRQRITTAGRDFYTTTNYIYETDVFLINMSFNLNKLTGKSKLPNSEFGEKEF